MRALWNRLRGVLGTVRLRQIVDQIRHRLSFIPGMYVLGAIVVVQAMLFLDRSIQNQDLPVVLTTTVDSARSVFTAIAGGLITSITLLLSMMLITIQLASSQFSPRTLRDWLGDTYLKHTVGLALGTTVFCLLALRSTRSFGEGSDAITPHTSVMFAVVCGVISLFGVVRSVDHVTQSLQIGSVARRIATDTIDAVERNDEIGAGQRPTQTPSAGDPNAIGDGDDDTPDLEIPDDAAAIESPQSGWIQQIRPKSILDALPENSTAHVVVPLGAFVPEGTPLMWVSPAPDDDDECRIHLLEAFAFGSTRTLQQDVGFGILQMTDIAVRALSPGVNDPSTANDLIVHLGDVMLSLWAKPVGDARMSDDDRTLVRRPPRHEEHLRRAFDPIRRYGAADPTVMLTMARTLRMIRSETIRRSLAGPVEPLDQMLDDVVDGIDDSTWSTIERDDLFRIASLR